MEATYSELEAGLDAFVEGVSDLLTAERMAQECETGTPSGLTSLARAKWGRLRALEGESLRAWIGAEVERAHSTILAACERIGCVFPEDQPEAVRRAVGLAGRVADSLLTVASRADLQHSTPALLDALERLYDALLDLEPTEPTEISLSTWTAMELREATRCPLRSGAVSPRHFGRLLQQAGLGRGRKGRRFGPSEVRQLIESVRTGNHQDAQDWIRGWTALLDAVPNSRR